jgi:hypothetical protein
MLFLGCCIPLRLLLVYLSKTVNKYHLKLMGYTGLILSVGFMYFYLSGTRTTGPEVFGDKIWWNNLRPIHSVLWLAFAISAIRGYSWSWKILLVDVLFGLFFFIQKSPSSPL